MKKKTRLKKNTPVPLWAVALSVAAVSLSAISAVTLGGSALVWGGASPGPSASALAGASLEPAGPKLPEPKPATSAKGPSQENAAARSSAWLKRSSFLEGQQEASLLYPSMRAQRSSLQNIYPAGLYAGKNSLPPGTYQLRSSGAGAFWKMRHPPTQTPWLDESFAQRSYLQVQKGDEVELFNCYARLLTETSSAESVGGPLGNGTFLAGQDLPPGTYQIMPNQRYAKIRLASSPSPFAQEQARYVDQAMVVKIQSGQYVTVMAGHLQPLAKE